MFLFEEKDRRCGVGGAVVPRSAWWCGLACGALLPPTFFCRQVGLPLFVVCTVSLGESTMAANGEGSEKGAEHPSAMSLFAPATQAAVSFHITCHLACLCYQAGCFEYSLRRTWYCFYVEAILLRSTYCTDFIWPLRVKYR